MLWALLAREISHSFALLPSLWRNNVARCAPSRFEPGRVILYSSNPRNSLSASAKERRDEEKRRLERKADVVIGKTSAKQDAQDFQLSPKRTEEEWMRQASHVERKVYRETEKGLTHLKMVCMCKLLQWRVVFVVFDLSRTVLTGAVVLMNVSATT